ncbi:hypothetical protein HY061_00655 [Candidatus Azambacteria bacterium]|nr:hypothetical protein [Candidatus Azambacteria bacterium]
MKAIVLNETGGIEVLKVGETTLPEISPHDYLVKIKYAEVNYANICYYQLNDQRTRFKKRNC